MPQFTVAGQMHSNIQAERCLLDMALHLQRLNLDALLGSPDVLQPQAEHGRPRLDVGALGILLQQRYKEQEQDSRRYQTFF